MFPVLNPFRTRGGTVGIGSEVYLCAQPAWDRVPSSVSDVIMKNIVMQAIKPVRKTANVWPVLCEQEMSRCRGVYL